MTNGRTFSPSVDDATRRCPLPIPTPAVRSLEVTDGNFEAEVLGVRGKPVLVDCWAEWCGPCRTLAPAIDQIAADAAGRWKVTKLNVDFNPATAGQYRVEGIPTLLIFKDGKVADRIVGLQSKSVIESRLSAARIARSISKRLSKYFFNLTYSHIRIY